MILTRNTRLPHCLEKYYENTKTLKPPKPISKKQEEGLLPPLK